MRTIPEIRSELDRASERRSELWQALDDGHDSALVAELKELQEQIASLWEEHRIVRAQLRFGDRERIIARARAEERLERAA